MAKKAQPVKVKKPAKVESTVGKNTLVQTSSSVGVKTAEEAILEMKQRLKKLKKLKERNQKMLEQKKKENSKSETKVKKEEHTPSFNLGEMSPVYMQQQMDPAFYPQMPFVPYSQ